LNLCQLYDKHPLVLALFIDNGSCSRILTELQRFSGLFPTVDFAAVALNGDRRKLRRMLRQEGIKIPVGVDTRGAVAIRYGMVSCPQLYFAFPGGVSQGSSLHAPSASQLEGRVRQLVAKSALRQR
jgi:hypothetical protein